MIIQIKSIQNYYHREWCVYNKTDKLICKAVLNFDDEKRWVIVNFSNGLSIKMLYDEKYNKKHFSKKVKGFWNKMREKSSYRLFINESYVGFSNISSKKINDKVGYSANELVFYDNKLTCYDVALGKEGRYSVIYKNDSEVVATIDKNLKIIDHEDSYIVYLDNPDYYYASVLQTIYWDITEFVNISAISKSLSYSFVYDPREAQRNKYDPGFIQRVKALDGIVD